MGHLTSFITTLMEIHQKITYIVSFDAILRAGQPLSPPKAGGARR